MRQKTQSFSGAGTGGWFGVIREPFGGAWQSNVAVDAPRNLLAFSAVYSCVTIIASDIAKMGINLLKEDADGICSPVARSSPYERLLNKPNHYQTWYKFIEQWMLSKLLYGNAYVYKRRNNQGAITGLYVLDSQRIQVLVTAEGDVYYQISRDDLSRLPGPVTLPASEIMHDTMVSLWHPLIGVSPIYACGLSATMGNRIQANSTNFFSNMSRPSGTLTAPGAIDDETANRIKTEFEKNFANQQMGRLLVAGDGLSYQPMAMAANDAQLIEQLKWTTEDVARCFHVPLFKLGGPVPPHTSVEALNQTYYSDCLQTLIESAEAVLTEGLELPQSGDYEVEFDIDGLLRMDTAAKYDALEKGIRGGWLAPNEARQSQNRKPMPGGGVPYLQQQNYSLAALAKRDAQENPFASGASTTPNADTTPVPLQPEPKQQPSDQAAALAQYVAKELQWT